MTRAASRPSEVVGPEVDLAAVRRDEHAPAVGVVRPARDRGVGDVDVQGVELHAVEEAITGAGTLALRDGHDIEGALVAGANRTVACVSPASTASIRSPKRYSPSALRSWRRLASWPRRISSSAVGPSSPSWSKDAADSPSASTNSVPVSVVLRERIASSIRAAGPPPARPRGRRRSGHRRATVRHARRRSLPSRRRRASRPVRGRRYPRRRSGCGAPPPSTSARRCWTGPTGRPGAHDWPISSATSTRAWAALSTQAVEDLVERAASGVGAPGMNAR